METNVTGNCTYAYLRNQIDRIKALRFPYNRLGSKLQVLSTEFHFTYSYNNVVHVLQKQEIATHLIERIFTQEIT